MAKRATGSISALRRLVVDGTVVCDVEVATTARARRRGLLGRDGVDGALLLPRCPAVHTFGMRFPIDVAYLDRNLVVLDVLTMVPGRPDRPRLRARSCLEAEASAFGRWGLHPGSQLGMSVGLDLQPAHEEEVGR